MNSQLSVTPTTKRPLLRLETVLILIGVVALTLAPFYFYPIFLMKVLCFALFACAFNLLLGYTGILSFGHAAFSALRLFHRPCGEGMGTDAGTGDSRRRCRRGVSRADHRFPGDTPAGHLLHDDHPGTVADVFSSACRLRSPTARTASRISRAATCSA